MKSYSNGDKNKCPVCGRTLGEDSGDCFGRDTPSLECYKFRIEQLEATIDHLNLHIKDLREKIEEFCERC